MPMSLGPLRRDITANIPRWIMMVISAILGAGTSVLVALADTFLLGFGEDLGVRAVLVFLISWPVASVLFYWGIRRPDLIGKPVHDGLPAPPTRSQLLLLLGGLALIFLLWLFLKVAIFIFG